METKLEADDLRSHIDPDKLGFETTETLSPLKATVGQDRAVHAIEFSLRVSAKGYNLYVSGPTGTGRHSTIDEFVKKIAREKPVPNDWCYVYNFENPDAPIAIELPPGAATMLHHDMSELVDACQSEIPRAFESEEYEKRKTVIVNEFQEKRDNLINDLRAKAKNFGFSVEITAAGIFTFPIVDGNPLKHEDFEKLPSNQREEIKTKTDELQQDINHLLSEVRDIEKHAKEKLLSLDREIALFAIGHLLEILMEKYKHIPKVIAYLTSVQKDIVENLDIFKDGGKKKEALLPGLEMPSAEQHFNRYEVNVFISNSGVEGAPVVNEANPSYYNLFGRLEYRSQLGAMTTDFTMIKPGAIHRANGGYLIVNALELLTNLFSWDALKRALESDQAKIENIGEQFRLVPAATLQPEPIPLNIKVVIIGSSYIYNLLYHFDEDFRKFFRIKADFNWEMNKNDEHIQKYAEYIAAKCFEDSYIRHFDKTAVAKVIEYGSRVSGNQKKLSTKFFEIDNLISEANFWAEQDKSTLVSLPHVQKAIEEKIFRSNLIEEKIQELIDDGTIMIDTDGERLGQINGLSIYELGDYYFGRPSKITCSTFVGKSGVVNIEREVKLGGPIHNKGVLILAGYLGGKYASDKPMAVSATVTFEQLYSEVEGDSASSSELYAILSSLSSLPIRQDIAVTGSVNQKGEIQPIGGVNQKIEGFYEVCKIRGLTGNQGVMIPGRNVKNLMLKDEVVEAVRRGEFNIWAVNNVDEGIEILTGTAAGDLQADGRYPENTVNKLVSEKLDLFGKKFKEFMTGEEEESLEAGEQAA